MTTTATPAALADPRREGRRPYRRLVGVVTGLCIIVALTASGPYLAMDPATAEGTVGLRRSASFHFPFLVVHALTAGIALLTGPWQFVRRVRRHRRVHRYLGRVYLLAGVLPASITGLVVAMVSTSGLGATVGFALLDIAWVTTAIAGYRAARDRRFGDHRRWMIRNFGLTFAGVTLRLWQPVLVLLQLPFVQGDGPVDMAELFQRGYVLVPWLAWVPNLLVVEYHLRRRRVAA